MLCIWINGNFQTYFKSYFQVVKSTDNDSVDSEQILGESIVVIESPTEIRVPDKPMSYEVIVPKCGDVNGMQHESTASQMQLNRRCLVKIVETLQFLARQGLALCGDNSDDDSNFMQTVKLGAKYISQLTD